MKNKTNIDYWFWQRITENFFKAKYPFGFSTKFNSQARHYETGLYSHLAHACLVDFRRAHPGKKFYWRGRSTKSFVKFIANWVPSEPIM